MSFAFRSRLSLSLVVLPVLSFLLGSCGGGSNSSGGDISTDPATIARGEASFVRNCSGCHNFRQDGIGPQLAGVTTQVSADWIRQFIKNPQQVISSGDKQASALHDKYKVVMPPFSNLNDSEVNAIIAFLHVHKQAGDGRRVDKGNALADPIKGTIEPSSLVVDLQPVTQIPASNPVPPLTRITKFGYRPDTHELFVVDLRGKLYRLSNNKPAVYFDLAKQRPRFIHEPGLATGFGSFAFHPDFAKNGLLYTTHTEIAGSGKADFGYPDSVKVSLQFVLTEWKTTHPEAETFSGTSRELLRIDMITESHGVQEITFNPGSKPGDEDYGLLYMGIGDGGCVQVGYPYLLRGKETVWGTVLRLDPLGRNSANGRYGIPRTNPFVDRGVNDNHGDRSGRGGHSDSKADLKADSGALGEIYAYGFRNPQRITWSGSGAMLICNIGQANIEALYVVRPGDNCGWPIREGSFAFDPSGNLNKVYPLPPDDSLYKVTYPVAEYDHDDGNAWAGGYEYRGTAIPQLRGKYLFGDIPSGRLFYIDMADILPGKLAQIKQWNITISGVPRNLKDVCGSDRVDLHFGRDAAGEVYIMTKADGKIYKLITAHQ